MSVKLRLRRLGNVNRPYYRVVAIDSRNRRDGRNLEELGTYDPLRQPAALVIREEPVLAWLQRGAQMSPTVNSLFRKQGILHKWKLMRSGMAAEEATRQVATMLDKRVEKPSKTKLSKKALAKQKEASNEAEKATEGTEAKKTTEEKTEPVAESTPES